MLLLLQPLMLMEKDQPESTWIKEMSQLNIPDINDNVEISDSVNDENALPAEKELFDFDPNLASEENLHSLGLASWQIKIIGTYRNKGGKFKNADDFGKMYGIGLQQFQKLKPYIKILIDPKPAKADSAFLHYGLKPKITGDENPIIELNSCDSVQLDKLPWIGKSMAARIIKYRDRLGGFSHYEQLMEVYGFRPELYEKIISRLKIDSLLIRKLKLNQIEYADLKKHPYLTPYQAKSIIKYREIKKFTTPVELEKNNLLSKESLIKLKPYLSFE